MRNREASVGEYRARIARALAFIQENLGGELSLEAAAEAACFSKYHFHRIFGAFVGESLGDHIRRLRLERAANFLENRPSMSVTEVAMASGFSSPSVLSRDFTAHFGLPPSRWREERRSIRRGDEAGAGGSDALPAEGGRAARNPAGADSERLAALYGAADGPLSVRRLPALRFASVLHYGGYGEGIAEAWAKLFRWAGPRSLLGPQSRVAGVSWDNPEITPPERCRYSACIDLPPDVNPSGEVVLLEFPARAYLCLAYRGPEAGLSEAYELLYRRHLPGSGFEPEDAPAIEFYRAPLDRDRLFDLEIAVPVRPLD